MLVNGIHGAENRFHSSGKKLKSTNILSSYDMVRSFGMVGDGGVGGESACFGKQGSEKPVM